jgi:tRNA(adenine34) deaminase
MIPSSHPGPLAGDERHMREALRLAADAEAAGEVPVGAVVVVNDVVIARGVNAMEGLGATAHAEVLAINMALAAQGKKRLEGATLYVTLEPCAMCAGAIVLARVSRVVFGAWDDKAGMAGSVGDILRHPKLNHSPEVRGGVLAEECGSVLTAFFAKRRG